MSFLEKRCHSRGGAADSSQMSSVLCHNIYLEDSKEETFVSEESQASAEAVPFDDSRQLSIVILNGKIVNNDEIREEDVLLENGKISRIGKDLEFPPESHKIDASDKYIFPGPMNCNAHFLNKCKNLDLDQLMNLTKYSTIGGCTSVIDKANVEEYTGLLSQLQQCQGNITYCNIGIKACFTENFVASETVKSNEVASVHCSGETIFRLDDHDLLAIMKNMKESGGVVTVDIKGGVLEDNVLQGRSMFTPVEDLEETIIRKICGLALQTGVTIGLFNVCNPWSIQIIEEFRARGLSAFSEISSTIPNIQSLLPLTDCSGLLLANSLAFEIDQNNVNGEDFDDWLSVAYHHLVNENGVDAKMFVELTSTNPAKLNMLYPKKGCIKEGSDADIIIWDPMQTVLTHATRYRSKIGVEKEAEVYGLPEIVIIDGKIAVADCQIRQTAKLGKCLEYNKNSVDDNCNDSIEDHKILPVKRMDIPGHEMESKENRDRRCLSAWDKRRLTGSQNNAQTNSATANPLDKEIGMYQRPKTAHGVRNQQDSTFSVKSFF